MGGAAGVQLVLPPAAHANAVEDLLRGTLRPDLAPAEAVVVLMDACKSLKSLQALASTPADSEERFRSRAVLPGWAARLRRVQEAGPVVAALIAGSSDRETTLSAMYGGTGGAVEGQGSADGMYIALGRVLTISGRTIRKEAQAEPERAALAATEIGRLLAMVPKDVYAAALEPKK